MTGLAPATVGWCPGALRPMETGDGLVLRLKPSGGRLGLTQAAAIAGIALRFGNGHLDLTGRANLQIRGVRAETLEPALAALADLGLLDADPAVEAIRNIVASPLAGLDPSAAIDVRPIVAALEGRLVSVTDLRRLPAKWSVVVDGDGLLGLAGIAADLRFEAHSDGSIRVGLGADPLRARCEPRGVVDVFERLCRLGLGTEPRRMSALLRQRSAASLLASAGLEPSGDAASGRVTDVRDVVGLHALADTLWIGVAAPFGGVTAEALRAFAEMAEHHGAIDLRLTPWRTILATGLNEAGALVSRREAAALGLVVDANDPRLRVAACPGAPACHRGSTPVRDHAARLATALDLSGIPESLAIHVSGCAKGCAHGQAAPWTLVGHDGLYDVVEGGRADDPPVVQALSFQDAALWLSRAGTKGRF